MESLENSISKLSTTDSTSEDQNGHTDYCTMKRLPGDEDEICIQPCMEHLETRNETVFPSSLDISVSENSELAEPITLETIDITPDKSGEVLKQIIKPGEGDEFPGYGDRVSVHYTGFLLTKEKPVQFDSNRDGEKCEFNLGQGMVIKGWDLGLATMKKGEVALFIIQPEYAYGLMGNPPTIPAHTPLLFEVELYEWKLEDLSSKKDGSILRKVVEKGEGTVNPNEGAFVKVRLVGYYNETVFEDCEKEFTLGEACSINILEAVELALFKFHLKEKSLIYLKGKSLVDKGTESLGIPKDTEVKYEITLLSFEKAKDVWEMNTDEKLEKSIQSKEKGISYIKTGHFKVALRQFRWILACLENEPGVPPESKEFRNSLLLSGYLNIALCLLKLENHSDAIKFCTLALKLDPDNEKALFRRGQARMLTNDCEEALQDFQTLCSVYPENKSAKQYIINCQEKIKKQKLKDRGIYNKMFDKFIKQDEERMKSLKTETGVWQADEEKEKKDGFMNETQRLIERNNSFLRDANIIELSNTAF